MHSSDFRESILKTIVSAVLAAIFLFASSAMAQDPKDTTAARSAAESWLKLVDQGDTGAAWRASSANVRKETNQFFWGTVINVSRTESSSDMRPPNNALASTGSTIPLAR